MAKKNPLSVLRESAQRILILTDDCETLQQAAQQLQIDVNAASNAPDRHKAMQASLAIVRDRVGHGMMLFIELYANGSAEEEWLDGTGE